MDRIKRLGLRFSQAQNETIEKPKQRSIHIKKNITPQTNYSNNHTLYFFFIFIESDRTNEASASLNK